MFQMDPTSALDVLHREWPVIKGAPYSFFISLVILTASGVGLVWLAFRGRLQRYREQIELLERDAERMEKEIDRLRTIPSAPPSATPPISVHVEQHANPTQTQTNEQRQQASARASTPRKPERQSNLKCVMTPTLRLVYSQHRFIQDDEGGVLAASAEIVNLAGDKGVAPVSNVSAQLIYRDGEGRELLHSTGTWLREYGQTADFRPAEKHVLLVILLPLHGDVAFAPINDRNPLPHRARQYTAALRDVSTHTIDAKTVEVTVTLLDSQGDHLGNFILCYQRTEDGAYTLTKKE